MTQPHSIRGRTVLTVETLEDRLTPSSTSYLTSLYGNLLHRAPGPADLAYWGPKLDAGTPASAVAAAVVASPEYQGNFIRSCYGLFLNHNPSSSALSWWLGQTVSAGMTDPQAEASILDSAEFSQAHPGSTNDWLNTVYEKVLGRPAGSADLSYWDGAFANGASTFNVALGIVTSPEANARGIRDAYQQLLGRDADSAALTYWGGVANDPQGMALVLAGIAGSPEYLNHAGGSSGTKASSSDPYTADPAQFANLPGADGGPVTIGVPGEATSDTSGSEPLSKLNALANYDFSNFDMSKVLDLSGLGDIVM
jgi:hypothetical protein